MGSLGRARCCCCKKWRFNMYIPDSGDGPLCGDCQLLCIGGVPVEGVPVEEHETDSSETDPDMPALVDSSSDEDVRPHEAESDTQSESSQEELWHVWFLMMENGEGRGKGGGKGFPGSKGK